MPPGCTALDGFSAARQGLPPTSPLFPYTTLFRSEERDQVLRATEMARRLGVPVIAIGLGTAQGGRSEEHTSELQSQSNLVCRLLLEKKNGHRVERTQSMPHNPHHSAPTAMWPPAD